MQELLEAFISFKSGYTDAIRKNPGPARDRAMERSQDEMRSLCARACTALELSPECLN